VLLPRLLLRSSVVLALTLRVVGRRSNTVASAYKVCASR
jgi:hypothetical protein